MTTTFIDLVKENELDKVRSMLTQDPSLANTNFYPESLHSDGFPLYHASRNSNMSMLSLLLKNGAHPDAVLNHEEPRERGMPLMNAIHAGHFEMVHVLLDYGASLFAHPYCATPFIDNVLNQTWGFPEYLELTHGLIASSFESLPNEVGITLTLPIIPNSCPEVFLLLQRIVKNGGRPSYFTLARHEHLDLTAKLLQGSPNEPELPGYWPRGSLFNGLAFGASWCGINSVLDLCVRECPDLFTADVSKGCIERAIRSHNRDGGIDEYCQLIERQLEFLKSNDQCSNSFSGGSPFTPQQWLLDDFIESSNYGFRCLDLSTPGDLDRLASLFEKFGYPR